MAAQGSPEAMARDAPVRPMEAIYAVEWPMEALRRTSRHIMRHVK